MLNDRRKFMISTGMAAGTAVVGQLAAEQKFSPGETAQADVAKLVSQYGSLKGMSQNSKGLVRVQVKIKDHGQVAKMFTEQKNLPFEQVVVTSQNTMEFTHRGERFAISHQVMS